MVIVGRSFEFDPSKREQFLASRVDMMCNSRAEAGCLEYTFADNPIDPTRVVLYERWESQAHLEAHLAAMQGAPKRPDEVAPISSSISIYDVAGEHPLG
ncbi:MAG: putative quinol monooxygenase [Ilumatobacteraceae bacterium]